MIAYFPNGSESMAYEARYCNRCVHQDGPDGESGCDIWLAHILHNYGDCNNEKSILHLLIPLTKDNLGNEACRLFFDKAPEPEMCDADKQYLAWQAER